MTTVPATHRLHRYRYHAADHRALPRGVRSFVRSTSFHSWYDYGADSALFCESADQVRRPADRVVFVGNNDPALLFCMDRKGWLLTPEDSTVERIKQIRKAGAKLAIVPGAPLSDDVWKLLKTESWPVFTAGRIMVFRLQ